MRAKIDAARIITKEMKAQMRKDARMEKLAAMKAKKAAATEEKVEETAEETQTTDEE